MGSWVSTLYMIHCNHIIVIIKLTRLSIGMILWLNKSSLRSHSSWLISTMLDQTRTLTTSRDCPLLTTWCWSSSPRTPLLIPESLSGLDGLMNTRSWGLYRTQLSTLRTGLDWGHWRRKASYTWCQWKLTTCSWGRKLWMRLSTIILNNKQINVNLIHVLRDINVKDVVKVDGSESSEIYEVWLMFSRSL